MSVPVIGVDHLTVRVGDGAGAERLFAKLGFALRASGEPSAQGNTKYIAPFAGGTYLELVHISPGASSFRPTSREQGPIAVALATSDSHGVHTSLLSLGCDSVPPHEFRRPVELPDGVRDARFLNVRLPPLEPQSVDFFTCQHLTPELVWRSEWSRHPNGADRVTDVIAVCPSPQDLLPSYQELYGAGRASGDAESLIVTLGADTISILTPTALKRRFPSIPAVSCISGGQLVGATFRVRSLATVEQVLSDAGVPFAHTPAASIVVEPMDALDTLIEFRAPSS